MHLRAVQEQDARSCAVHCSSEKSTPVGHVGCRHIRREQLKGRMRPQVPHQEAAQREGLHQYCNREISCLRLRICICLIPRQGTVWCTHGVAWKGMSSPQRHRKPRRTCLWMTAWTENDVRDSHDCFASVILQVKVTMGLKLFKRQGLASARCPSWSASAL